MGWSVFCDYQRAASLYRFVWQPELSAQPDEPPQNSFARPISSKSFHRTDLSPGGQLLQLDAELRDKLKTGIIHAWGRELNSKNADMMEMAGRIVPKDSAFWEYGRLTLNFLHSEHRRPYTYIEGVDDSLDKTNYTDIYLSKSETRKYWF